MKYLVFVFLMTCVINGYSQEETLNTPQIGIKIAEGEAVEIDGVTVFFKVILEDSRCPKGLNCIWAGRARILVDVTSASGETTEKVIILGEVKPGEDKNRAVYSSNEMKITALMLYPYPDSSVKEVLPKFLLVRKKDIKD